MLQLRPTFSESWYRVVNLKPRLRATAQISRQFYRGDRWYVVRDPAGNQFHRLSDAAYKFVGLLDGRRTVGEAWELVGGQLEDDAPTQPEVIQILSQLFSANLVETDISPDATVLLRRHKKQMQRKMQGRLMNVLFPRIPIWDPNRFLTRWMPVVRPFISKLGAVLWLVMVISAIGALTSHWTELKTAASDSIDPKNWLYLWFTFVVIKFIHELGHAFTCRRFGGEVHEMGIMFLVLVPTPYVDASTAWAFPNKWARMLVGAGGMMVELFFASIMAFVWIATHDSHTLVSQIAYNAMLIASVTTIIFNANPLLRYDGYYMLSDFWEIPNLQQKSKDYTMGLIKRHIFRVKKPAAPSAAVSASPTVRLFHRVGRLSHLCGHCDHHHGGVQGAGVGLSDGHRRRRDLDRHADLQDRQISRHRARTSSQAHARHRLHVWRSRRTGHCHWADPISGERGCHRHRRAIAKVCAPCADTGICSIHPGKGWSIPEERGHHPRQR